MKKAILLLVLILMSETSLAVDIENVFKRMNNFNSNEWMFTVVSDSEDDLIEQFDPRAEPKWNLFTINQKTPTEKELKKYHKEKAKEEAESEDDTGRLDLDEMVEMTSLVLIEETNDQLVYSFKPIIEDEEKISKSLAGKLWVNKADNFIERFDFFNTETFSPAVSVTVKKLHTSMYFQKLGKDVFGPHKLVSEVKGKAFVFKSFDEHQQQEFKNFSLIK